MIVNFTNLPVSLGHLLPIWLEAQQPGSPESLTDILMPKRMYFYFITILN